MPRGPKGQKRPADAVGAAVMVAKIATGELADDELNAKRSKAGKKGAKSRQKALTHEQRSEIASIAAEARWKKS